MNHTIFENEGTIDLDTITTFGVSVKETSNPIGQFGTGLKYAIAILLREGHDIHMYCGSQEYFFWKKAMPIRGQTFDICMMNDTRLPFTTDLGKHWELWMAFRELYSNTKDEKGECWVVDDDPNGAQFVTDAGSTRFVITGDEFADIARERGSVFLEDNEPIYETENLEVIDSKPTATVYARGIRVAEFERPLMSTYNLKGFVDLTEDRTLKSPEWTLDQRIMSAAAQSTNTQFIERVITAPKEYHESGLDFSWTSIGDTFIETARRVIKTEGSSSVNSSVVRLIKEIDERERKRNSIRRRYIRVAVDLPEEVSDEDLMTTIRWAIKNDHGAEDVDTEMEAA